MNCTPTIQICNEALEPWNVKNGGRNISLNVQIYITLGIEWEIHNSETYWNDLFNNSLVSKLWKSVSKPECDFIITKSIFQKIGVY